MSRSQFSSATAATFQFRRNRSGYEAADVDAFVAAAVASLGHYEQQIAALEQRLVAIESEVSTASPKTDLALLARTLTVEQWRALGVEAVGRVLVETEEQAQAKLSRARTEIAGMYSSLHQAAVGLLKALDAGSNPTYDVGQLRKVLVAIIGSSQ